MKGGEWVRRGTHLTEKNNVYVAKDTKIDINNNFLLSELEDRKKILEENGFTDGFENISDKFSIISPELYKYFIPWEIHYTHNQYGYGHITYDYYLQYKGGDWLISYRYGIGMDGENLKICKNLNSTNCKPIWWISIDKPNRRNFIKASILSYFIKKGKKEISKDLENIDDIRNALSEYQNGLYSWAVPPLNIYNDILKAWVLAKNNFFNNKIYIDKIRNEFQDDILFNRYKQIEDPALNVINKILDDKKKKDKSKKQEEIFLEAQNLTSQVKREVESIPEYFTPIGKKVDIINKTPKSKKNKKKKVKSAPTNLNKANIDIDNFFKIKEEEEERVKLEQERLKKEEEERVKLEQERLKKEEEEHIKLEQERLKKEEEERIKLEQERLKKEEEERIKLEQERQQREAWEIQQREAWERQQREAWEIQQREAWERQQREAWERQQREAWERQQREAWERQQREAWERQQREAWERQQREAPVQNSRFFPTQNMTPQERIEIMQSNFNSYYNPPQQSNLPTNYYIDSNGMLRHY
jgi:hypothetical protein